MNKVLVIDIDQNREPQILIAHANRNGDNIENTDDHYNILSDMDMLCEALCTMIHAAKNEGIQDSATSLRQCIKHLELGFSDASYTASLDY